MMRLLTDGHRIRPPQHHSFAPWDEVAAADNANPSRLVEGKENLIARRQQPQLATVHADRNVHMFSVSIIDCQPTEYWGEEEKKVDRAEASYKLTADFNTRTKKLCKRDKWAMY